KEYQDGKPVMDSLYFISDRPVLEHAFNRVGEFWLRLRVSNEFGSTFYYMTVEIRAGMERGMLVLSSDEAGKGRLSFCSVVEEANELLEAKQEDFDVDVWTRTNPDYELLDAQDMCMMNFEDKYWNGARCIYSIFVISKSQQCLYELDKGTLLVLRKIDLRPTMSFDIRPVALVPLKQDLAIMSEDGQVVFSQLGSNGLINEGWGTEMKGVKLYQANVMNNFDKIIVSYPLMADNEHEKMVCYTNMGMGSTIDSESDFQGFRIVNFTMIGSYVNLNTRLLVVSQPKADAGKVRVTNYNTVTADNGRAQFFKKDKDYRMQDYDLSSPLALRSESDMLYNGGYNVIFYNNGNTIYRWRYTGGFSDAGNSQVSIPAGEITCMAQSPDHEYLYVGAYDAGAAGLKGNVYIYKTENLELVKSFIGVADKPLKLFYKDVK
ncbi:MAG: hypothetical protein K2L23_09160, partial [Odoribacter sp.]|nr:hypothetical protein [Odoribacter sp.]